MFGGPVVISLALLGTVSALPGDRQQPPEAVADSFIAAVAALCTDVVNQRSFEVSDNATAAGLDLLTFAIDPPTPAELDDPTPAGP